MARTVYAAASTQSEKLEAYMLLQDAEELYYATTEGRDALVTNIQTVKEGDLKSHWVNVLDRADSRRQFVESGVEGLRNQFPAPDSPWAEPNKVTKPALKTLVDAGDVMRRSETLPSGEKITYEWDKNRKTVWVEVEDNVEDSRAIGSASTVTEAETLIARWHSRYP